MKSLTDSNYWDETYRRRSLIRPLSVAGISNFGNLLIYEKLQSLGLHGKRILEIGAGDSGWLTFLAKAYSDSSFTGLDYSDIGCSMLRQRAESEGVEIDVVQEDMFVETSPLHGTFDIATSYGVLEHFDDLRAALIAKSRFIKGDGALFTLIPNMAGLTGALAKNWNYDVYAKHNPHDWDSFREGHSAAGLKIIHGGYLGSANVGVLSSCIKPNRFWTKNLGRVLTALNLVLWAIESRVTRLPSSRSVSPYIYAVSAKFD